MATGLSKLVIVGSSALILSGGTSSDAQVATDGTAGPRVQLAGPDFQIGADLGRRAGRNLFHSFERFSLTPGERATFSGPDAIRNVISRVTGGERSRIDGTVRSAIPGADFYFINAAGLALGPNANLDVQGSFHVSTADELRFTDGTAFSATDPAASSFTVAAPDAFGFLGSSPAPILVDQSVIQVPPGETLSIVGGDIDITGGPQGFVRAEAGEITLAAVGGPGEARIRSGAIDAARKGDISLIDRAVVTTSGDGGGTIRIRGGRLVVDNQSLVFADNFGEGVGGTVEIRADSVEIRNSAFISADDLGQGTAGRVDVTAERLALTNGSIIQSSGLLSFEFLDRGVKGSDERERFTQILRGRAIVTISDIETRTGINPANLSNVFDLDRRFFRSAEDQIFQRLTDDRIAILRTGAGPAGSIALRAGALTVEDSLISTEGQTAEGGRIEIEGKDSIDLVRSHVISNGVRPAEGDSVITLRAPLIIVNASRVVSLTRQGEPLAGSGEARLLGDLTVISAGSEVTASSTVEITGQEADVGSQVVSIEGTFIDTAPLRARCGARRDIGASSLTGVGRGGLPPSPDGPLAGAYLVEEGAVGEPQLAMSKTMAGTAPADVRLASLSAPCAPLD